MTKFQPFNNRASKLLPDQVIEIRSKYAAGGYTQDRLAREYQVTTNTIRNIVNGVTWQHLAQADSEKVAQEKLLESERKLKHFLEFPEDLGPMPLMPLSRPPAGGDEAGGVEDADDAVTAYLRIRAQSAQSVEPAEQALSQKDSKDENSANLNPAEGIVETAEPGKSTGG